MLRHGVLLSTFGAMLASVSIAQEETHPKPPDFPDFAKPEKSWRGATSEIVGSRYLVVDNVLAWTKLWQGHAPSSGVPRVDFTNTVVLAVFHPQWTTGGFRIDRVAQGSLASDGSSYNVFLKTDAKAPANCFEMLTVHRTHLDFRFYAQGDQATVSKAKLVARIDAPIGDQPKASLIAAAEKLLQEHAGAKSKRQSEIIAMLTAFGEPLRPYLNRIAGGDAGLDPAPHSSSMEEHIWPTRRVFAKLLADEVAAPNKALHHSEVAVAKAIAEVAKRIKVHGAPWYARKQVRCVSGIWFVRVHGTFQVSSDWETCNQKGVNADVAFRVKDGKLLHCKIRRGNADVNDLIQQNAPGVIPVEDKKK